ncbi:cytochrome P450 6a8-like isoform X1 [Onthophagus taurus]|uniref:cytochrome P450 6a8-like isoform X1 n=2 Tax=Onthophagus taurus TaxID=166361 RepID=UPI0039BE0D82
MEYISYFNKSMNEEHETYDKYFIYFFYFLIIYIFYTYRFYYFSLKNVPILNPTIPFGDLKKIFKPKKPRFEYFQEYYNKFKLRGHKHGGIFMFFKPYYVPVDLNYVEAILGKDFDKFSSRGFNVKSNKINDNLFNLNGEKWKILRVKTTKILLRDNIKKYLPNVEKVLTNFTKYLDKNDQKTIEIQEINKNFSLDLIANLYFGIDLNNFIEKNRVFEKNVLALHKKSLYNSKFYIFSFLFPYLFKLDTFPKKTVKYFKKSLDETIDFRETNQIKKNDILQVILEENKDLKIDEIVSQCLLLITFTNETISNTLNFLIFELSRNLHVQDKLREEIQEKVAQNELNCDLINQMDYLNQVLNETLRLYPIIPTIIRNSMKDYQLPGDKNEETLSAGTGVLISILGIHKDPEIYENPDQFIPERFAEENCINRHHYAFLPFGEGPRLCPAIQFSKMILKVTLITLIRRFRFVLDTSKTKNLAFNKGSVVMRPKNSLYVRVEKLC